MRTALTACLLTVFLLAAACPAAEVYLSVAASMTDVTRELVPAYRERAPAVRFHLNFASSGALARQIEQGAPADILVSANPGWMTYLVEQGRIAAGQVRTLAHSRLVFAGHSDLAVRSLGDLASLERIAIGSPRSVPAGEYARQALVAAGLYERLRERLVMAQNVRQALVYADRGEVDGAFVYATDIPLAKQVVVLLEVPPRLYDEVTYPVGLTTGGAAKPAAVAFYDYLGSREATEILDRFGFLVGEAKAADVP